MKQTCIRCKYYKIDDDLSGYCRIITKQMKKSDTLQAMVRQNDTCDKWIDCGQQYYIRLGWIKAYKTSRQDNANQ